MKNLFFLSLFLYLSAGANYRHLSEQREWRKPNYENQQASLGWSPDAFAIPKGMEEQVKFWIDIYTKYNTQQGVLHDSEYVEIVYEMLDFAAIDDSPLLNSVQREAAKEKLVNMARDKAIERLNRFAKAADEDPNWSAEDKRIFAAFKKVNEPNKFINATSSKRIRFQGGLSDRMKNAIFLSGRYIEEMEKIFQENALPKELVRIIFVESSFNIFARSKVGASGLWQIMSYTGRGSLRMNQAVDKRNHPMEATRFAAKLLRSNYNMLESWPLAVTGYNHGPTGVKRIAEKNKTRDLAKLVDSDHVTKSFGFASRNFYATFLAALTVEQNANQYFNEIKWSTPLEQRDWLTDRALKWKQVVKWFDGDDLRAQVFNPHIQTLARENKVGIPKGTLLHIPSSKYNEVLTSMGIKPKEVEKKTPKQFYRVEKGDTLKTIADRFNIDVLSLKQKNSLEKEELPIGQILEIP